MNLVTTTKATSQVVTNHEVADSLVIGADDVLLPSLIKEAVSFIEERIGLKLGVQTVVEHIDQFPTNYVIRLHAYPIQAITIVYDDADGVEQTMPVSDYSARLLTWPPKIYANSGWPATESWPGSVRVTMTCGYTAENCPDAIKRAIKMLCAHWYEHREAVISGSTASTVPLGLESILQPYMLHYYS